MRQRENGSKQRHAVREGKARSDSAIFPSKAARKPAETSKALKQARQDRRRRNMSDPANIN